MGALIVFLLVLALFAALIFVLINNSIISSKNNVIRSWSDVVTYQRQKTKLLPDLERLTRDYLSFEKQLLSNIAELRSALTRVSGHVPLRGVKTEARMPWSEGEQGRVTDCHSGGADAPRFPTMNRDD